MSRSERRAYKRMMKNQDPYAVPGNQQLQRARASRQRRRAQREPGEFRFLSRRFLVWALGGGGVAGLIAFSIAWPGGMPFALYLGLAALVGWIGLCSLFRLMQRRMPQRPPG